VADAGLSSVPTSRGGKKRVGQLEEWGIPPVSSSFKAENAVANPDEGSVLGRNPEH
jgi:hypothetical protein